MTLPTNYQPGDSFTAAAHNNENVAVNAATTALAAGGGVATLNGAQILAGKTLTAPKIVDDGYIADANGNKAFVFRTSAAAVNTLALTNAPTGVAPILAAVGTDPNISVNIDGQGTGRVYLNGGHRAVTTDEALDLSNKRIIGRVIPITSSATPPINTDVTDIFVITAQAVDITSMSSGLTGTPADGDLLRVLIKGTASRAIVWGAKFVDSTVALPSTTSGTVRLSVGLQYDLAAAVWQCIALA